MSNSKCVSCGSTRFENVGDTSVRHYKFKLNFIQCASCGGVVGVLPYHDPGVMGELNKKAIAELKEEVSRLSQLVGALASRRH